jgi:hypothetical protein
MASRPQRPRRTQVGDAIRAPTTATWRCANEPTVSHVTDSGSTQGGRGPLRSAAFRPNDGTTRSDYPPVSVTPGLAAYRVIHG